MYVKFTIISKDKIISLDWFYVSLISFFNIFKHFFFRLTLFAICFNTFFNINHVQ